MPEASYRPLVLFFIVIALFIAVLCSTHKCDQQPKTFIKTLVLKSEGWGTLRTL